VKIKENLMAKTIYVYFAWKDDFNTLSIDDKQTFRGALRRILPPGIRSEDIESAIDETGLNVTDWFGENFQDGMKITVSRNKVYEGGAGASESPGPNTIGLEY
jgi:hypothetical protein